MTPTERSYNVRCCIRRHTQDETILSICWKELIDGNTCSFAEVKIADASQFRRKLADDTYNSQNMYYATQLAESSNAVVAMNADFYLFRTPGIVAYQREVYRFSDAIYADGYSEYNCIDTCFVTADGDFLFMHRGDAATKESVQKYIDDNAIQIRLKHRASILTKTWMPALLLTG